MNVFSPLWMIYVNLKQNVEKSFRKIWRFQEKSVPLHSQLSNTPFATLKQGAIAQLVEQRTENPCVPGSIPGGTTQDQACKDFFTGFFVSISSFLHLFISHPQPRDYSLQEASILNKGKTEQKSESKAIISQ